MSKFAGVWVENKKIKGIQKKNGIMWVREKSVKIAHDCGMVHADIKALTKFISSQKISHLN